MGYAPKNHLKIHHIGWKANYFKSADVSMLGYGCDVSQLHQFFDRIQTKLNIPHPYVVSSEGEKGNLLLKKMDFRIRKIS